MQIITAVARGVAEETRFRPNTGEALPSVTKHMLIKSGFTKPDKPINNPLVAGYRKPSSYNCPAFTVSPDGRTLPNAIGAKWSISGVTFRGNPANSGYTQYTHTGNGCGTGIFSAPVSNVNNLRMKLLNNIRSEVLDVAMVLAEMKDTADTIGNGLMRIARTMDMVKRRKPDSFYYLLNGRRKDNRRPTDKFLRETAGAYLEWKYGIMPTVYDVRGACKALDMNETGSFFDNPPLLVARAKDVVQGTGSGSFVLAAASGGFTTTLDIEYYTERKARCDYRVSGEGLRGLNRYGLGLGTIATVAFDKTPFSFVLNMAIPIAELIKAWTALAGVDVVGYCETLYQKAKVKEQTRVGHIQNGPVTFNVKDSPERIGFERRAYASPPMPLPYVRNPIKVGNAATVLALFTQLRDQEVFRR